MYTIREEVFETNSSSTHSVSIKNRHGADDYNYTAEELKQYIEDDNYLHIDLGEFGWGIDTYTDAYNKLSYILTMLGEVNHILRWDSSNKTSDELRSQFENTEEWNDINSFIRETLNCNGIYIDDFDGYIDHQSYEDYNSVRSFLDDYATNLVDFIFNPYVSLIIDNDNH